MPVERTRRLCEAERMTDTRYQSFTQASSSKHSAERLAALRAALKAMSLDGFLAPRADEHQSEYAPASEERLAWLTGFTGSAGLAIVLARKAALFVDGRYTVQVRQQIDLKAFTPVSTVSTAPDAWLAVNAKPGAQIGYDPRLHTVDDVTRFTAAAKRAGAALVPTENNPIDFIWTDRPAPPLAAVSLYPDALAGRSAAEKIAELQATLKSDGLDALVISDPHAMAWLFNIRGGDVGHTPLPRGYAVAPAQGKPTLFIDARKLSNSVRDTLHGFSEVEEPLAFPAALRALGAGKARVRLDAATAGASLKTALEAAGAQADIGRDPIALMKARKNSVELDGARAAHRRDGAAMTRFLAWFDRAAPAGGLTEIDAVTALERFRDETGALRDVSFPTIAGAGPNAALPHYRVSVDSNRRIERGIFLIDSGAQYEDGTTDITRTLAVGEPTARMKDRFTRVLKGMIAISCSVFPTGVSGAQLDSFARTALWAAGLDFDHGTGHGVGHYLSVHEGPQRIAKTGATPLEAGMILSNEPGYYSSGAWGIRIENLVAVEPRAIRGAERPMLGFETLTLAPIDRQLVSKRLLTREERRWLDAYHARVCGEIGPLVDEETRRWLEGATAPL